MVKDLQLKKVKAYDLEPMPLIHTEIPEMKLLYYT